MYIKGLVIMTVFLQTALSKKRLVTEIVCENEEMNLRCPKGQTIEILSATFGKKNYKYCYQPGLQVENCEAENTFSFVKKMCNLKQRCRLSAVSKLFGDPCVGTFKYLEVTYRCLKNNNIISLLACENDKISFGCFQGKTIKLVNALYGRQNGHTCTPKTTEHTSLKCDSITSLEILASKCDRSHDCSLTVNSTVFGDPCIPLTYKYLELDYVCISNSDESKYNVSCEDEKMMTLSCEKGYINVKAALFGKANRKYCHNNTDVKDINCEAIGTLNIMKFKCDFRRYCHVEVSTNVFGDPCPGPRKYLEVYYECVDARWNTAVACEHDKLQIGCAKGYFLWIVNAFFGKRDQILCYKPEKVVVNNTCDASNAVDIVESRCQNKKKCTVDANVQTFGDPCCYSYKYLEVDYVCKDRQRLLGK